MTEVITVGELFAGGGGSGLGILAAGLAINAKIQLAWAIEYDTRIAEVYETNLGNHAIALPIQQVDPHKLEPVDLICASPVCKSFSTANVGGKEHKLDIITATATANIIRTIKPKWVILENVRAYVKSLSYYIIKSALVEMKYQVDEQILDAADFGVPQNRIRFIVRASRVDIPPPSFLAPTHAKTTIQSSLFSNIKPWVSWYEAIADLIPTLPESQFAPWQLKRLQNKVEQGFFDELRPGYLTSMHRTANGDGVKPDLTPAYTVLAHQGSSEQKAFLVERSGARSGAIQTRSRNQPTFTVKAMGGNIRPNCQQMNAFLISGRERCDLKLNSEPYCTMLTKANSFRAWLQQKSFSSCDPSIVTNLLQQGKVVLITPPALKRFQSFPDWYKLPDSKTLAVTIIGNSVPPLLMKAVARSLIFPQ